MNDLEHGRNPLDCLCVWCVRVHICFDYMIGFQ